MWTVEEAEFLNLYRRYRSASDRYENDEEAFDAWWNTLTEREQRILQEEIWSQTDWPEGEYPLVEFNW